MEAPTLIPADLLQLLIIEQPDIKLLDRAMEVYFINGLAPSTRRVLYVAAINKYMNLCNKLNFPPLPVSEISLCHCISNVNMSYNPITVYLAAIQQLQVCCDFTPPSMVSMARLQQVAIERYQDLKSG